MVDIATANKIRELFKQPETVERNAQINALARGGAVSSNQQSSSKAPVQTPPSGFVSPLASQKKGFYGEVVSEEGMEWTEKIVNTNIVSPEQPVLSDNRPSGNIYTENYGKQVGISPVQKQKYIVPVDTSISLQQGISELERNISSYEQQKQQFYAGREEQRIGKKQFIVDYATAQKELSGFYKQYPESRKEITDIARENRFILMRGMSQYGRQTIYDVATIKKFERHDKDITSLQKTITAMKTEYHPGTRIVKTGKGYEFKFPYAGAEYYQDYLKIIESHPELSALYSFSTPSLGVDLAAADYQGRRDILVRYLHEYKGSPSGGPDIIRGGMAIFNNPFVQITSSAAGSKALSFISGKASSFIIPKFTKNLIFNQGKSMAFKRAASKIISGSILGGFGALETKNVVDVYRQRGFPAAFGQSITSGGSFIAMFDRGSLKNVKNFIMGRDTSPIAGYVRNQKLSSRMGMGDELYSRTKPKVLSWEKTDIGKSVIPSDRIDFGGSRMKQDKGSLYNIGKNTEEIAADIRFRGYSDRGTIDTEIINPEDILKAQKSKWIKLKKHILSPLNSKMYLTESGYKKALQTLGSDYDPLKFKREIRSIPPSSDISFKWRQQKEALNIAQETNRLEALKSLSIEGYNPNKFKNIDNRLNEFIRNERGSIPIGYENIQRNRPRNITRDNWYSRNVFNEKTARSIRKGEWGQETNKYWRVKQLEGLGFNVRFGLDVGSLYKSSTEVKPISNINIEQDIFREQNMIQRMDFGSMNESRVDVISVQRMNQESIQDTIQESIFDSKQRSIQDTIQESIFDSKQSYRTKQKYEYDYDVIKTKKPHVPKPPPPHLNKIKIPVPIIIPGDDPFLVHTKHHKRKKFFESRMNVFELQIPTLKNLFGG